MNELNKKLAEWAGLHPRERSDGHTIERIDQPNFTNSLDACFKWLVPKLQGMGATVCLDILLTCTLATIVYKAEMYEASEKVPALALCLAIEKLIDKEASDGSKLPV